MVKEKLPFQVELKEVVTNLNAVTSATDGSSIASDQFEMITVFVEVTSNSGAVTVSIEGSHDGTFGGEEVTLDAKTYTATNGTDSFSYSEFMPYIRTTTSTHSSSTVSTVITGRS